MVHVLHIGVGKASACRMRLEAVCEMSMGSQALKGIAGILKALFRMKCTYDPTYTEEEELNCAFTGKCIVTTFPTRPKHDGKKSGGMQSYRSKASTSSLSLMRISPSSMWTMSTVSVDWITKFAL